MNQAEVKSSPTLPRNSRSSGSFDARRRAVLLSNLVGTKWDEFLKSNSSEGKVTLRTVVFEGVLTVRNLEHFKHALVSGIGRAKAYGCGLLTIAHYRGDSSG